ncbi:MAG TPA: hypothetical protein VGO60_04065 [Iamia sp.]|jgi:hypothetical protein|nr:hypothetical protein [Iamia sp.]
MADGREPRTPAVLRAWRWIWEPSERKLHVDSCPRCGATVVVPPGRPERAMDRVRLAPPPDEGQLLAACADHGWAPYNERSLRLRRRRDD